MTNNRSQSLSDHKIITITSTYIRQGYKEKRVKSTRDTWHNGDFPPQVSSATLRADCERRERAEHTNLKKGSLAVVWTNFLISKTNFLFCIFCMFLYFLSITIFSATILRQLIYWYHQRINEFSRVLGDYKRSGTKLAKYLASSWKISVFRLL